MINEQVCNNYCMLVLDIILGLVLDCEKAKERLAEIINKELTDINKNPILKCELKGLVNNSTNYRDKLVPNNQISILDKKKLIPLIKIILVEKENKLYSKINNFYKEIMIQINKKPGFAREIEDWGLIVFNSARRIYSIIDNMQ